MREFAIKLLKIFINPKVKWRKIITWKKEKYYIYEFNRLYNSNIPDYILYKKIVKALKDIGFVKSNGVKNGIYFVIEYYGENRIIKYIPYKKEIFINYLTEHKK